MENNGQVGNVDRHFWRCRLCLSIFATDGTICGEWACVCGGHLEWMGKVEAKRLVREFQAPACDDRCTNARGPSCDCKCNGLNHGTKRVVTVRQDGGQVPTAVPLDPEKAIATAKEFTEAIEATVQALEAKYGSLLADFRSGRWISNKSLWWELKGMSERLSECHHGKIHKTRMEKVCALRRDVAGG